MTAIPDVLRDYISGLKARDVERISGTVSEDLAFVTPAKTLDKARFLEMLRVLYAGFPDWHYDHDEPEIQGGVIAIKWRQGGTHTAGLRLPGFRFVPATHRHVQIPEHHFYYRVRGDRIVEIRPEAVPGGAPLGIFEQIGVSTDRL